MPNYLERVASSAARRGAIAKPPVSGPPVLPVGRDLAIAPEEEQFLETLETSAPARSEERGQIGPTPKPARPEESKTTATQDTASAAPLEPKPRPRSTHERLSSDSRLTVQVPRTLRPISTANVPTPVPVEPPRVRASTSIGPEEFTIRNEPKPVVNPEVKESATASTPVQSKAPVAGPSQAPAPINTEATAPDVAPIPRVDAPLKPAYNAEPSPPRASPVHVPPAAGNTTRQEPSRVHIGSLEVLVNNHPQVARTRPAPAPSRTESLNLEKRYLDRFRLRH